MFRYLKKIYKQIIFIFIISFIVAISIIYILGSKDTIIQNIIIALVLPIGSSFVYAFLFFLFKNLSVNMLNDISIVPAGFIDRTKEIEQIIALLHEGKNINIYGENGIGKSYIAQQLAAILNRNRNIKEDYLDYFLKEESYSFYFDASQDVDYTKQLESLLSNALIDQNIHGISKAKDILNNSNVKKYVFIFDEVRPSVSAIDKIDKFVSNFRGDKFNFILVSEKNIISSSTSPLEFSMAGKYFTDLEIKELLPELSIEDRKQVLQISGGIPLLIDIIIKNTTKLSNSKDKNQYFLTLLFDISLENNLAYGVLQKIVASSLFNNGYTINENVNEESILFLAEKGIVNYDIQHKKITMYKLIEELLHESLIQREKQQYLKEIERVVDENFIVNPQKAIISLLALTPRKICKNKIQVEQTFTALLIGENYDLLERSFYIYDTNPSKDDFPKELSTLIIYGKISSLMGIGQYLEAQKLFETLNIKQAPLISNKITTEIEVAFLFQKIELDHFLNNFQSAFDELELLEIALKQMPQSSQFRDKFLMKCYELKAHLMSHLGEDNFVLTDVYNKLTTELKKQYLADTTYKELYVKSLYRQALVALMLHSESFDYNKCFQEIKNITKEDSNEYNLALPQVAMYYRQIGNFKKSEQLLNQAIAFFEKNNHRIIYDLYFARGDLYREMGKLGDAEKEYQKSKDYAERLQDKNLLSYCELGNILINISMEKYDNIKDNILNLLMNSEEGCLKIHQLHLKMVLALLHSEQTYTQELQYELRKRGFEFEEDILNNLSSQNLNKLQLMIV